MAIVLAIINLVIIILKAYLSGSVDRTELIKKVQDAQEQIDKMAESRVTEMREEIRTEDTGLESMQEEMDQELRKNYPHKE